jgi:hypothetical protein
MSVMITPSRLHTESLPSAPFEKKLDCCPLSLPATLTRSTITPGTVRIRAQGSRELGIWTSSSFEMVVAVPTRLVSTTGASPVTVTVSSTVATLREKASSVFWPLTTVTGRVTPVKPVRATRSWCVP